MNSHSDARTVYVLLTSMIGTVVGFAAVWIANAPNLPIA